ncbi:MAG: cysteine desulfurase family protein [Planctomycetota bacterium]
MNVESDRQRPYEGPAKGPTQPDPRGADGQPVYLDHNGSTPMSAPVRAAIRAYFEESSGDPWGNAGAAHPAGLGARHAIDRASDSAAQVLGVAPHEITWTSGGTESNNAAILGLRLTTDRQHIVCGRHEHLSVVRPVEWLERQGVPVTWIDPAPCGRVLPETLAAAVRGDTALVALMLANNETGILQPVHEAREIARASGAHLFVDAVCGAGKLPFDANELGCDLLSISGHKLHAPKGIGLLYVREGIAMEPLIHGCGQQGNRRSGTENTMGAVALAAAMEAHMERSGVDATALRVRQLKDRLWNGLRALFAGAPAQARPVRNGSGADLPGTLSVWFPGRCALALQTSLGEVGVSVTAQAGRHPDGRSRPSHVLLSMGASAERAGESLRMSLGSTTTAEEIDAALVAFQRVIRPDTLDPALPTAPIQLNS